MITAASLSGSLPEPELELGCAGRPGARRSRARVVTRGGPAGGRRELRLERRDARRDADGLGDAHPALVSRRRGRAAPVVVVTPRGTVRSPSTCARARPRRACEGSRAALVASADHGHAHDPDGPFGFHPAAAEFDGRMVELVSENRLEDAFTLEEIVGEASADSLWQVLVLHGALGGGFAAELPLLRAADLLRHALRRVRAELRRRRTPQGVVLDARAGSDGRARAARATNGSDTTANAAPTQKVAAGPTSVQSTPPSTLATRSAPPTAAP